MAKMRSIAEEVSSQAAITVSSGIACDMGGAASRVARRVSPQLANRIRLETRSAGKAKHDFTAFVQESQSDDTSSSEESFAVGVDFGLKIEELGAEMAEAVVTLQNRVAVLAARLAALELPAVDLPLDAIEAWAPPFSGVGTQNGCDAIGDRPRQ